eukprot:CAMPEP_0175235674 /NCGR_PEP_ID=MMETSP0093-20121207/27613_1 /TAXON_ID=311494 /ORGANISM="Alexandrium monilatum, Strain CCMP3105" /LENGTH=936 /DNA_ID=CAMNT_0016529603 /DNA_START=8 /DNA_END=2815 /DNA_ORIENTATION=-
MPAVLKLTYQDEVRRAVLPAGDVMYEGVCEQVRAVWPELQHYVARYRDEEGDLCTLLPATFPDFLAVATSASAGAQEGKPAAPGKLVLRLELEDSAAGAVPAQTEVPLPEKEICPQRSQGLAAPASAAAAAGAAGGLPGVGPDGAAGGHARFGAPAEWQPHLWYLSRLRASGALSSRVVAGLLAHALPGALAHVANDVSGAGRELRRRLSEVRSAMTDLTGLLASTAGLEHCAARLRELLASDEAGGSRGDSPASDAAAGEALLAVLTSVDALPFEARVSLLQLFYAKQEAELLRQVDAADARLPAWAQVPLLHERVSCDGCAASPIRGPRFRCRECPDYDLCGECFASKGLVHGGPCSNHGFDCVFLDWRGSVAAALRAAREGCRGWTGWKGKCKGKGKAGSKDEGPREDRAEGAGEGKGEGKGDGKFEVKVTELHSVARSGDVARLEALLADEAMIKDVNSFDQHRRTPLHLAAFFGQAGAVERLLAKAADVQKEAMDGFLPLHFAAQAGHLEVVRMLVRKVSAGGARGAVKQHVNRVARKNKRSALHLALLKGHTECARFLVLKGASTELKTSKGETAIDLCQSEELRNELRGDATAAAAAESLGEAGGTASAGAEPPAKRRAIGPAAPPAADASPGALGASGAAEPDAAPVTAAAPVVDAPPMAGLPAAPPPAAQAVPGIVACGPWRMDEVEVSTAETDRSYPAGVAALADAHWSFAVKESPGLADGPVWSLASCEGDACAGRRVLRLKLQRSTRRLLVYTELTAEGLLLPRAARCGACGLSVLVETADGLLTLSQGPEGRLLDSAIAGCTVDSTNLTEVLRRVLAAEDVLVGDVPAALGSARLLAVLELAEGGSSPQGEAPASGHRHELIVGVRLAATAAELSADGRRGARPALAFVRFPALAAPEAPAQAGAAPTPTSVDELLGGEVQRL